MPDATEVGEAPLRVSGERNGLGIPAVACQHAGNHKLPGKTTQADMRRGHDSSRSNLERVPSSFTARGSRSELHGWIRRAMGRTLLPYRIMSTDLDDLRSTRLQRGMLVCLNSLRSAQPLSRSTMRSMDLIDSD